MNLEKNTNEITPTSEQAPVQAKEATKETDPNRATLEAEASKLKLSLTLLEKEIAAVGGEEAFREQYSKPGAENNMYSSEGRLTVGGTEVVEKGTASEDKKLYAKIKGAITMMAAITTTILVYKEGSAQELSIGTAAMPLVTAAFAALTALDALKGRKLGREADALEMKMKMTNTPEKLW
jgi:hypothetical protein